MHKIAISAIAFIFFVLFVAPFLLLGTLNSLTYFDQPPLDFNYELFGSRTIKQEFISYRNFLNGFGMSIKNPNLKNKKQLILYLYDDSQIIRRTELNGLNIPDGDFVKFNFSPIPNSINKKYEVVINSPDSLSYESLGIFLTKGESYELGELTINGIKDNVKIAAVGFYAVNNKFDLLAYVYKNFLINFSKDINFVIFYIILIMLFLSGLAYKKRDKNS